MTIDTYLVKAASKAFQKIFKQSNVDISQFTQGTLHHFKSTDKQTTSQLKPTDLKVKSSFAADVPASLLEIHQVSHSVEALPITNPHALLTLHFTQPQQDVVYDGSNLYFDINTLGDAPISYDLKMKPVQRVKLSITFDASRVDEVQAV